MSRNGVYRNGHVSKRPARPAPPEQASGSSSWIAMNMLVEKIYSHFKVPNVNTVAIFYGIVFNNSTNVVPFDVHFHYIDNALMPKISK